MISPESDFQPEEFEVFDQEIELPTKPKNDPELSSRERIAQLSEWLYQQYLAFHETELVEDEEKLLKQLFDVIDKRTHEKRSYHESARREIFALIKSYWPLMIGAGGSIGTAFYLFSGELAKIMIHGDVFLHQKSWEAITDSSIVLDVLDDQQFYASLNKIMIALLLLSVTVSLTSLGMLFRDEDSGGSLYGFRSSIQDIKYTHEQMKKSAQDAIHLMGAEGTPQLTSEQILSAVQTAAKRISIRHKIQNQRSETIQRRRQLLAEAGIGEHTELWDRSDDFSESVDSEVNKNQRRRGS